MKHAVWLMFVVQELIGRLISTKYNGTSIWNRLLQLPVKQIRNTHIIRLTTSTGFRLPFRKANRHIEKYACYLKLPSIN